MTRIFYCQCVDMLKKLSVGDSLYPIAECLLNAVLETGEQGNPFAVIQNGVACDEVIQGLASRLRAKGPEVGSKLGLLETVNRLGEWSNLVNILSINTPNRRGIIYCNVGNSDIVGLTMSPPIDHSAPLNLNQQTPPD